MTRSTSTSTSLTILYISLSLTLLAPIATAQQLLVYGTNALPSCAQSCTLLADAQNACIPPAAPATDQAAYESCFCQSAYLRTLYSSPNGVCDSVCGQNDLVQIQSWYKSNCADGGASAATAGGTTTVVITTTSAVATAGVGVPTTEAAAAATPSTTGSSSAAPGDTDEGSSSYTGSWWSAHWKWVLMLIILFLGLALLALLAVLLKRRHDRRMDKVTTSFNAGITTRATPTPGASVPPSRGLQTSGDNRQGTYAAAGMAEIGEGRGRATPTREQYGYGGGGGAAGPYAHEQQQRLGSRGSVGAIRERDLVGGGGGRTRPEDPEKMRGSPLAKEVGVDGGGEEKGGDKGKGKGKRKLLGKRMGGGDEEKI